MFPVARAGRGLPNIRRGGEGVFAECLVNWYRWGEIMVLQLAKQSVNNTSGTKKVNNGGGGGNFLQAALGFYTLGKLYNSLQLATKEDEKTLKD